MEDEAKERRLANLKPFRPGQSGNPGGRSKAQIDVRDAARAYTEEAIDTLVLVMRNGRHGERVMAANALLDRGWGRPQQSADVNIKRDIYDYSNAELAAIIAGCRGEIDEEGVQH